MTGALILLFILASAIAFTFRFEKNGMNRVLLGFIVLSLEIYSLALLLSAASSLGNEALWLAGSALLFLLSQPQKALAALTSEKLLRIRKSTLAIALPILITVTLVFLSSALTVPGNWDVISYHLPRALYFLQFDSFATYPSPYWAQITHPTLGPTWTIFAIITIGLREHFLFLPHFLAWLVTGLAIYGTVDAIFSRLRKIKLERRVRVFFVLTLSLFPLTQMLNAGLERNDTLVTAYSAIAFYFLFLETAYALPLGIISLALAMATKATALPLIPVWIIVFLWLRRKQLAKSGFWLGAISAIFIFAVCGYGKNYLRYGQLIGPPVVMRQQSLPLNEAASEGTKNIFRFGIDSGTPDGWPGWSLANSAVRVWRESGIALAERILGEDIRVGRIYGEFSGARPSLSHEDQAYFGFSYLLLAGFSLVVFLWREKQKKFLLIWLLPAAWIFLFHAFTVWYAPWHGRYYMVSLVFLIPLLARGLERSWERPFLRYICTALLVFLYAQNIYSITYRDNQSLFPSGSRLEQVFRNRPDLLSIYQKIDLIVPEQALMATRIPEDQPEYALFGPKQMRLIISTNDIARGILPLPANAEWLVFHKALSEVLAGDIELGQNYFLRDLRPRK